MGTASQHGAEALGFSKQRAAARAGELRAAMAQGVGAVVDGAGAAASGAGAYQPHAPANSTPAGGPAGHRPAAR
eukprot:4745009-Pyramimonas_sp.AAC.1